jgi:hypothetical protein
MSKIFHFNELEEFFGEDDWKMQIDVTDIWNQYNKKEIDLLSFNKKYYDRLIEYKSDISEMGEDVWIKLQELLEKMIQKSEENELISIYDDIYNWADQNDVLIKTK